MPLAHLRDARDVLGADARIGEPRREGDRVQIEMLDEGGQDVFGSIDQEVKAT